MDYSFRTDLDFQSQAGYELASQTPLFGKGVGAIFLPFLVIPLFQPAQKSLDKEFALEQEAANLLFMSATFTCRECLRFIRIRPDLLGI